VSALQDLFVFPFSCAGLGGAEATTVVGARHGFITDRKLEIIGVRDEKAGFTALVEKLSALSNTIGLILSPRYIGMIHRIIGKVFGDAVGIIGRRLIGGHALEWSLLRFEYASMDKIIVNSTSLSYPSMGFRIQVFLDLQRHDCFNF
jgi:hypothetical protein